MVHSRARYGGNGGVKFDGEMLDYSVETREDRGEILEKFKVREDNILYSCYLRVSKGGSATLHVNPDNRQSISYWGRVKPL